jgi:hypothetical protein
MLCDIRDDKDKELWISQLKSVVEVIVKQQALPKEAQVSGEMLVKLNKLHDYLENQILLYDKIERI